MTAFEKATRRKIFYGMAVLFFVVTPLVLLYSQGYLVDFTNRHLVPTGGIFVKALQSGATVRVDSEFQKETSFISHGVLIANLLPRRYALRVEKEGFQPWQKVVRVANSEVLEFRNVFLPPAAISPETFLAEESRTAWKLFSLAGRPEFILLAASSGGLFTLSVVNLETGITSKTVHQASTWWWDEYSSALVIGRGRDTRQQWYRLPFDAGSIGPEERFLFRGLPAVFSAASVRPHPTEPHQFYFFAGGALFLQGRSSVPVPIAEELVSYVIGREHLYFISKNGFFVESTLEGGDTRVLGRKGLFLLDEKPAEITIAPQDEVLVVDSARGLFLFQPGRDNELGFVSGNVNGVDFNEKGDRMLIWDSNRLWVYWLRDNPDQPFDLARSKKQIFYSAEPITQAAFNTPGTYIIFSTAKDIRMVEADDRGSVNAYELVHQTSLIDSFVLDKKNFILYWSADATVYRAALR